MVDINKEIELLKERNRRVDLEKAWETSTARKFAIAIITYVVIFGIFILTGVEKPFLNAVIPTSGFLLSTLSLAVIKKYWIRYTKQA